jgi:hypothetical protein
VSLNLRLVRLLIGTALVALAVPFPGTVEAAGTARADGPGMSVDIAAAESAGVPLDPLQLALRAVTCATRSGEIASPPTLTLIDYTRRSVEPRLWVFDLRTGALLFREPVAHGRNTGADVATRFSDTPNSLQSSLGLFVTGETYVGSNGYSLRLDGLEPGVNGHARERALVMHGAPYVDAAVAARQGRMGRSWGCPALREAVARDLIDTVRGGGVIFAYYPDSTWLKTSRFLDGCGAGTVAASAALGGSIQRPSLASSSRSIP